jgi:general stress protein 26
LFLDGGRNLGRSASVLPADPTIRRSGKDEPMPTPKELTESFWKALKSDMTVMLSAVDVEEGHARPMTAQLDEEQNGDQSGPIWFFTSNETELAESLGSGTKRGLFTFASKSHGLFATVHGDLAIDNDRAVIDRLWNAHVAAWYEKGKDDPQLCLLRFDPDDAEIWENGSSLVAGVKALLGVDPKKDYKDKVAKVLLD